MQNDTLLSEKDAIKSIIISVQNKITTAKVRDRLYQRQRLENPNKMFAGPMGQNYSIDQMMAANQKNLSDLEKEHASNRKHLASLLDDVSDTPPDLPELSK
jgi:hypothetical protein